MRPSSPVESNLGLASGPSDELSIDNWSDPSDPGHQISDRPGSVLI